jgi:16S rRNA (adenine1518-N6/adenine1519-N6)-dimethyltransferase
LRFVKPKKALGQHFLNDISIAERIVESLSPSQNVLEIGPGTGILTKILIKKKIDLKLVEIDKESVDFLTNELDINDSLIYNQDFLKMNLAEVFGKNNFSIIGNFPYNISTQIVFKIIDYRKYIPEMCGMFQYEVAERICENEGSKKYGIISVITQAFYETKLLFEVSNNFFSPPPKVNSAVILLKRKKNLKIDCDEKLFFKIVKLSFQQRRKTLRNSLKQINLTENLREHTIFDKRPEQLSVNEFIDLTNLVSHDLNN